VLNTFLSGLSVVNDLKVTAPATTIAGQVFQVTVTAEDAQGNPVGSYNGTVHFASSDSATGVVLPADSTLVNGQGSFSATLVRAGPQTLTGALPLQVVPAVASSISLAVPGTVKANQPFNVTVTMKDAFGNLATGYRGTTHFTSSDLVAQTAGKLPADYTFAGADAGSHV